METGLFIRSFLAAVLTPVPLVASGFPTPPIYPLAGPHASFGDLNRDGKPDFVSVISNQVSISLNRGDGKFFPPNTVTLTGIFITPDTAFVADFNGDGKLDIAGGGTNSTGGSIIWVILGNGDGTFSAPKITSGCGPLAVGDFNGDRILDVIACPGGVMFGKGDGTFGPKVGSSGSSLVAVADFHGDGKADLLVMSTRSFTRSACVQLSNGDGTFVQKACLVGSGLQATVGDFNGDGKPDILLSYPSTSQTAMKFCFGKGDGTFSSKTGPLNMSGGQASWVDMNGDGLLDIVVSGRQTIDVLINLGGSTFAAPVSYPQIGQGEFFAGDLNGDGKMDLALTDPTSAAVVVYLGTGSGHLAAPSTFLLRTTFFSHYVNAPTIALGDFNGDGKLDLVAPLWEAQTTNGYVTLALGDGLGRFASPTAIALPGQVGEFNSPVVTGDFNHDGKLDVAIFVSGTPGSVYTLLGNGDGPFQPVQTTTFSLGTKSANINCHLLAGDFNGDGKLDLLALTANGGVTLLGNGNGTFSVSFGSVAAELYEGFIVGDYNRDGKLDLVGFWTRSGKNYLGIFLGNGNGGFQPGVQIANNINAVAAGDFNADGKLDLVVINYTSASVEILAGNGDGTFAPPVTVTGLHPGDSIVAADFNGDGKTDLLTYGGISNTNDGFMFVAYGKGDGTFQTDTIYLTPPNANQPPSFQGLYPTPPVVGDLNGDGRPDLVLNGNLAADVLLNLP